MAVVADVELAGRWERELTYGMRGWRLANGIALEEALGYDIVHGAFEDEEEHSKRFPFLCLALEMFMARKRPAEGQPSERAILRQVEALQPQAVVSCMEQAMVLHASEEGKLVVEPQVEQGQKAHRQQWRLTPAGHLQLTHCLRFAHAAHLKPGAALDLVADVHTATKWEMTDGSLRVAAEPRLVLDVNKAGVAPGTAVCLWLVTGKANQRWRLKALPDAEP